MKKPFTAQEETREPELVEPIKQGSRATNSSHTENEIKNAILTKQVACTYAELTEAFRISRRKIKIILTELVSDKK